MDQLDIQLETPRKLADLLFTEELPESSISGDAMHMLVRPAPKASQATPVNPLLAQDALSDALHSNALISDETRSHMNRLLLSSPPPRDQTNRSSSRLPARPRPGANDVVDIGAIPPGLPAQFSQITAALGLLKEKIINDLGVSFQRILTINLSRREAVAQYLDRLAGHAPGPATSAGHADAAGGLRRWVEGPRSSAQNEALRAYFEEIALFVLGQAIILKSWSDRGVRSWSLKDLSHLNTALDTALKPKIPTDRGQGWQVTIQNIYSWYLNPLGQGIQNSIWETLQSWRFTDEGPGFLISLIGQLRRAPTHPTAPRGYDPRLFQTIWDNMPSFGFDPSADPGFRKRWTVFSPTLRDGAMVRSGHVQLNWTGTEASAFNLMIAELAHLWWGPSAPPLWAISNGLETHAREQILLPLGATKRSLLTQISEMEAFDVAIVLEERVLRGQGRGAESHRFRELSDSLPAIKRLRASGTSLGDLQACIAVSKLRPGGLLWWAREEPLSSDDGADALNFLLERAKIVCEWDLSELGHSLPSALPLFPKHLFLLERESRFEERLNHRPHRVCVQGQIRSHIELPLVLKDALLSAITQPQPHGQWELTVHRSTTPQKDWAERWPDPASQGTLRILDRLRERSLPLVHATTIRPTPEGDRSRSGAWSVHPSFRGLWVTADSTPEGRRLLSAPLPRPGREAVGSGFMVLFENQEWIAPLRAYLESEVVRTWLDMNAERRGERWVITEPVLRMIPVPKTLFHAMGLAPAGADAESPLPGEWNQLASEVAHKPEIVREALSRLPRDESAETIRAVIHVKASRALERLLTEKEHLLSLVDARGKVRWAELLGILPKEQCGAVTLSPLVQYSGGLPLHVAIARIERVKTPLPSILLATESGHSARIGSETPIILEMLWEQLAGLNHPTWSELVGFLKVPKRLETVQATANEILLAHGQTTAKRKSFSDLIASCSLF